MSEIKEIRTYKDIQDVVFNRSKINDNETNRNLIKEMINSKYQEISYEKAYRWCGSTRSVTLNSRYTTGTISVINGSRNVTGAGTAWTILNHQNCKLYVNGSQSPYKILRIDEVAQTMVLDQLFVGTTNATASYTIFKDEYGLFPDMQDIRKLWIPGTTYRIYPVGTEEMDSYRELRPFSSGLPRKYTIHGFSHYHRTTWADFLINTDFWEESYDDEPKNKTLIIWPGIITSDRIAQIRYTKIVPPMLLDDDEPLIPYEYRPVLPYGVIDELFLTNRDLEIKGAWSRMYKDAKKKMLGDIETVDDELKFIIDRRQYAWRSRSVYSDEDYEN